MLNDHYTIAQRFWDGKKESGAEFSFDKEGKEKAINRAIVDLTARTLKRKTEVKDDRDEEIREALLPRLEKWFEKPETEITEEAFDKWHNEACEAVLIVLRKFYTNNDMLETPVQYGKTQKIVNMTMKGLYCLKGADAYEEHFKYCHMALDSFTLEWFRRYIADQWFNPDKKQKLRIKITAEGGPLPKWSNLDFKPGSLDFTYEKYKDNPNDRLHNGKYHYMFFVKTIREYFADTNEKNRYIGLTPLQAEFYIWPEIQLRMATEAFLCEVDPKTYKESKDADAERKKLKNLSADDLIQRVKDTIQDYHPQ